MWVKGILALAVLVLPQMTMAGETVSYTYDAKGRLIRVVTSGGPGNGAATAYDRDKADNRKTVKTTGASR